jgi:hypothetical protein
MADKGVMGWDLYSTLVLQSEYQTYYKTQVPIACPNDGEPLQPGPPSRAGVWFCKFDGWSYPRDWDPDIHSGM